MNDEFRQMVIDALQRGEDLPSEWARVLFPPEKREYELVYHGKECEEDILANTMAIPLQPVSTFGNNGVDWYNKLIFGDNLQAIKRLIEMKQEGMLINTDGTLGVRLIYIDPHFATKQEFKVQGNNQVAYVDKVAGARFIEFLRKQLLLAKQLLADNGSIFVHLDTKMSHYIKVLMDEIFGKNNFINEKVYY
jgi:site-specific DNA-methyltransferase (adenine-specific)/adenine-specific DNA-methyltransferase